MRYFADSLSRYKNIIKALLFRKDVPLTVSLVITSRCDQRCAYCRVWEHPFEELDTKAVFRLIDDYKKKGTIWISIMGGEPLLRDDLGQIIRYAVSRSMKVSVSSNGILVPDRIDDLMGIKRLKISLDGRQEVHDALRGKGTFLKVREALAVCRSRSIPVVLDCTVTKHNLGEIDFLVDFAQKHDCVLSFQPVTELLLWSKQTNSFQPDIKSYRDAVERIINYKKKGAPVYNSLAGLRHLYHWPEPRPIFCCAGRFHQAVEPDGTVIGCNRTFHRIKSADKDHLPEYDRLYDCGSCWCASVVEFNLMLSFNIDALINHIRYNGFSAGKA